MERWGECILRLEVEMDNMTAVVLVGGSSLLTQPKAHVNLISWKEIMDLRCWDEETKKAGNQV